MTREEAKVLLSIIQAYAEGKTIQVADTTDQCGTWADVVELKINTDFEEYRIKPDAKYRPFKDAEECWQEMQNHQPFGWVKGDSCFYNIVSVSNIDVSMANVNGDIVILNFSDVMENNTFVDCATFGVKRGGITYDIVSDLA